MPSVPTDSDMEPPIVIVADPTSDPRRPKASGRQAVERADARDRRARPGGCAGRRATGRVGGVGQALAGLAPRAAGRLAGSASQVS